MKRLTCNVWIKNNPRNHLCCCLVQAQTRHQDQGFTEIIRLSKQNAKVLNQYFQRVYIFTSLTMIVHACSVTYLCLSLHYSVDCSPPGSSIHGILKAKTLEWVVISSSRWLITIIICLDNPMDRVVWWATVHVVTKSQSDTTEETQDRQMIQVGQNTIRQQIIKRATKAART